MIDEKILNVIINNSVSAVLLAKEGLVLDEKLLLKIDILSKVYHIIKRSKVYSGKQFVDIKNLITLSNKL